MQQEWDMEGWGMGTVMPWGIMALTLALSMVMLTAWRNEMTS